MNYLRLYITTIGLLVLTSCAQDLVVQYPGEATHPQFIKLQPNKPTYHTYVTIDEQLVVDRKNVRSVTITNVPIGEHSIDYVCDNTIMQHPLDADMRLMIQEGRSETHLIELPPNTTAYWVGEIISYIFLIAWPLFVLFVL